MIYWIRKILAKRIRPLNKKSEKMVRIFLAMQTRTDKTTYRLYVEMQETDIILNHSQIIKLLTREQYIEFTKTEALMFLVPYRKIYGKEEAKKLDGRKLNPELFKAKNGIIKL
jgi:hypothetical protein